MKFDVQVLFVAAMTIGATACVPDDRTDSQMYECLGDPDDLGESHPRHSDLQQAVERAVQEHGLPGAVLVVRDGSGVWSGAAGTADAEANAPMLACQPTRIASITKTYVAARAVQLADEGVLDLDLPIGDLVDADLVAGVANAKQATPRQLVSHEAGIPDFVGAELVIRLINDPHRFWTQDQAVRMVAGRRALFSPGAGFSYSNTNYVLIGRAMEGATQVSLEQQLQDNIFEPLGLDSTRYEGDSQDTTGVARGYFDLFGNGDLIDSTQTYAMSTTGAEGGIVSTGPDVRRFIDALFRDGTLTSPEGLDQMTSFGPTSRDPEWLELQFDGYGLGVMRWKTPSGHVGIGHSGDEFGYQAHAYFFPETDTTVVLLVNGSALMAAGDNLTERANRARDDLFDHVLNGV